MASGIMLPEISLWLSLEVSIVKFTNSSGGQNVLCIADKLLSCLLLFFLH